VALQIAIMKVLSSYPGGRASLAALKSDLALLASSGPEWTQRLKRLAANAPDLDIFSQAFVVRDEAGWELTKAGYAALQTLEVPNVAPPQPAFAAAVALQMVAPEIHVTARPRKLVKVAFGTDSVARRRRARSVRTRSA
jgi:hypothetical protein